MEGKHWILQSKGMRKILKILSVLVPAVAIIAFEIFLFKANYVSDTWLVGWDSTQPELNLSENFARNISAIWQEYRGLGVLDGMAHAANIVHFFYIYLLSLAFEPNVIRYIFLFLMHGLGGLGAYYLVRHFLSDKDNIIKIFVPFSAAFFYMLNTGVIQMFYVPLELFLIHFGFLPWLLLTLIKYLNSGRKSDLFIFFVVNFLGISQAHVPTIFIVYAISVFVFLVVYLVGRFKENIRKVVWVIVALFTINAFWGLPYFYSTIKNAPVITSAKINQLSNEEIVLRNEAYGDFKSVTRLYGFSLDYEDWLGGEDEKFGFQMEEWRNWLFEKNRERVGYVLFLIAIVGVVLGILSGKKDFYAFTVIFFFAFLNLGSEVPILSGLRDLIWTYIPFYKEVFRFAFTKFIIVYSLAFAIFLSYAIAWVFSFKLLKYFAPFAALALVIATIWLSLPAFQGNFIYSKLKVEIPSEYFQVFDYFKDAQHKGRVAILPQPTFWNWEFNRWGYRGSGFIWQGIPNPVLHRSFDPWSRYNESFYQEMANALYQKNLPLFEKVLDKYAVSYILIDESIFQPGGWPEALYAEETKELLGQSDKITKESTFGKISIYSTTYKNEKEDYVWSPGTYASFGNDLQYARYDYLFERNGDYISGNGEFYPFADLQNDRPKEQIVKENKVVFEEKLGSSPLTLPSWSENETYVPVDVYATYEEGGDIAFKIVDLYPDVFVENKKVTQDYEEEFVVELDNGGEELLLSFDGKKFFKVTSGAKEAYVGSYSLSLANPTILKIFNLSKVEVFNLAPELQRGEARECWKRENADLRIDKQVIDGGVKLSTVNAAACVGVTLTPELSDDYIAKLSFSHKSGTETPPETCLIRVGEPGCIDSGVFDIYGASSDWSFAEVYYELQPNSEYFLDITGRGSDDKDVLSEIEYKDVFIEVSPEIAFTEIKIDPGFVPSAQKIEVAQESTLKVEIPLGKERGLVEEEIWANRRGRGTAKNCDISKRGSVTKTLGSEGVIYRADGKGANCDYYTLGGLNSVQGNILRITGENREGRSIKLLLNNHSTRRHDIEHLLGKGSFDSSFVLIPNTNNVGKYDLNLETRAFGGETSVNEVKTIQTIPIPYNWLLNVVAGDIDNLVKSSGLAIDEVYKNLTFYYLVDLSSNASNGVLALAQAYEDGWQGYTISAPFSAAKRGIAKYFPWVGGQKLEHVKVNSWANGWIVPPGEGERTIVMVFWPQYLQFAGFAVLLVTILILFVLTLRERKTRSGLENEVLKASL